MKILVCISNVPDTTSKINFTDGDTKFDTNGVQFVINPNDEFGLTRAMWFKEKQGATVDLIIAGRESIDYNGGMVPGILSTLLDMNFVNTCISLEVDGTNATAEREIDGGKEKISTSLPLVIGGQKGLVEESDLRIPNMRGIMQARQKKLSVQEPVAASKATADIKFEKPAAKGAVKLVDADNIDELVSLLHNEAKVI